MAFANQVAIAIENAQLFEQAHYFSVTDPLTGLSNHHHFFDAAKSEIERSNRYGRPMTIMMIDVDHFKSINDIHGHSTGDFILHEIATITKNSIRSIDIVARYGGEEFIVLMPETKLIEAYQIAERVLKSVVDSPIQEMRRQFFLL